MIFYSPSDRDVIVNEYSAVAGGDQCLDRLVRFLAFV